MAKHPPSSADIEEGTRNSPRRLHCPPPHQPSPWKPWLITLIIVVDFGLFVYTMYLNDCPFHHHRGKTCLLSSVMGRFSFQPLKDNPLFGPSANTLMQLGGLVRELVINGEPWRLFTCMWLHAGAIHLATNMFSLVFVGVRLEQEFGFLRIGFLYVLSGFGGSLLSSLVYSPDNPVISVGASGALFGLLGAMVSELFSNWTLYENKCTTLTMLMLIISLNMAVGLIPRVDNSAHVGGFISGFFLGFVLLVRPQYGYVSHKHIPAGYNLKHKKPKYRNYQYVLWILALIALLSGYAGGLYMLFSGKTLEARFFAFSQLLRDSSA